MDKYGKHKSLNTRRVARFAFVVALDRPTRFYSLRGSTFSLNFMKPDPEYLRMLLGKLQDCSSPWPSIRYLESGGLAPDAKMLFHLQLLNDNSFVEAIGGVDSNFGFLSGVGEDEDDDFGWSDINLRLTARGHEFIEALNRQEVWNVIKTQFRGASLRTMYKVGLALVDGYARETIKKHVGIVEI